VLLSYSLDNHNPKPVPVLFDVCVMQLGDLANITRKTLTFYREQAEANDFDLVDIAESALRMASASSSGCGAIMIMGLSDGCQSTAELQVGIHSFFL